MSFIFWTVFAFALNKEVAKPRVTKPQKMAFDSQLVEGQIYRPDLSVVTGDTAMEKIGSLRLRSDFIDHMDLESQAVLK